MTLRIVRPGGGVVALENELLEETRNMVISSFTFRAGPARRGGGRRVASEDARREPLIVDGRVAMADGYACVLFELLRENLEVIAAFDVDGRLAGYYVNLNSTPKRFDGGYEITDWFLDVWVFPDLHYRVLDLDEFEAAEAARLLSPEDAAKARALLARVEADIAAGAFPPPEVAEFLGRSPRATLARTPRGSPAGRR